MCIRDRPYREIDAAELARVAGTVRHGGVVAIARPRPLPVLDPKAAALWARDGRPLLILDGVANPHNLGAIARSAAFFGLERMVLADRPEQALPSDAAYRVAAGGLEEVTLYRARLPAALRALSGAYRVLAAAPKGGAPLRPAERKRAGGGRAEGGRAEAERPVALVLGNEEAGLDPATLAACEGVVRIPGSGRVQSLNVAQAAAILLYALTVG